MNDIHTDTNGYGIHMLNSLARSIILESKFVFFIVDDGKENKVFVYNHGRTIYMVHGSVSTVVDMIALFPGSVLHPLMLFFLPLLDFQVNC